METNVWMVLKYCVFEPSKNGNLYQITKYRAATWRHEAEEVISKNLTEEEAVALAKLMQ